MDNITKEDPPGKYSLSVRHANGTVTLTLHASIRYVTLSVRHVNGTRATCSRK